jgi:hypothetical protein
MLDWMTMDSDLRSTYHLEGNNNPIYTVVEPGKFYWIKSGLGYPWDIQLYDNNFIYLWITELSYTAKDSYKKFTDNTNLPLVPRCAKPWTPSGQPGSTIKIKNTSYDLHTNCSNSCSVTLGLDHAINEVWGPYTFNSPGGNLPANLPALKIRYRYNCDKDYVTCGDEEDYWVTQRYGQVEWVHYVWIKSLLQYEQVQMTILNKLVVGVATPDFPCF